MTTYFDVHIAKMNVGTFSNKEIQSLYNQKINQIEEKRREIELDQMILEILEKEIGRHV